MRSTIAVRRSREWFGGQGCSEKAFLLPMAWCPHPRLLHHLRPARCDCIGALAATAAASEAPASERRSSRHPGQPATSLTNCAVPPRGFSGGSPAIALAMRLEPVLEVEAPSGTKNLCGRFSPDGARPRLAPSRQRLSPSPRLLLCARLRSHPALPRRPLRQLPCAWLRRRGGAPRQHAERAHGVRAQSRASRPRPAPPRSAQPPQPPAALAPRIRSPLRPVQRRSPLGDIRKRRSARLPPVAAHANLPGSPTAR